jgi:hypothetical protein
VILGPGERAHARVGRRVLLQSKSARLMDHLTAKDENVLFLRSGGINQEDWLEPHPVGGSPGKGHSRHPQSRRQMAGDGHNGAKKRRASPGKGDRQPLPHEQNLLPPCALWPVKSGQPSALIRGHTATVTALAFHPAGTRLASVSQDGVFKVWDFSSRSSGRTQAR